MYKYIIEKGIGEHSPPDLIFLSGDMAFAGDAAEYKSLEEHFIAPLKAALPDCPIFTIPGNHDVDRSKSEDPRTWIVDKAKAELFQATNEAGAAFRKDVLVPRFAAFAAFEQRIGAWGGVNWLETAAGAVSWAGEINGAKIAIAGVNTAWLCHDSGEDWGTLTPGRYMLQDAIDKITPGKPDLLIVLGHHPLASLGQEKGPPDAHRIRERLKQANALYLHGHLHASGTDSIGDALRTTLTIQAPSAFQAYDDERWRNGILWGEADLATRSLILEPFRWNEHQREYKFDVDAGYNSDRAKDREGFRLALPGSVLVPVDGASATGKLKNLPEGWERIDRARLTEFKAAQTSSDTMAAFFDGIIPVTWELALANGVQRRAIAAKLVSQLRAAHSGPPKPVVVLLSAAGSEGKSTALLHAAAGLIEDENQAWTCLWRQSSNAELPKNLLAELPRIPNHAWVVVIDDADNAAAEILQAVQNLKPRVDVHVLLAAREADWQVKKLAPGDWRPVAAFRSEPLVDLKKDDALRIVRGWKIWGDEAMGNLKGYSEDQAADALVTYAHDLATRHDEGALLGALLIAREGGGMRDRVRDLLHKLAQSRVIDGRFSLLDIYTMIAAMHSQDQRYMTRSVLAFALGCEVEELEREALFPLRREAMSAGGQTYVLARHQRIATTACSVMREDHGKVDEWFPFLARAALKHFLDSRPTPDIAKWNSRLANHLAEGDEASWPAARAVAAIMHQTSPGDRFFLSGLANIFRRTGRATEAMAALKSASEKLKEEDRVKFTEDRVLFTEWGAVAGALKDYGLDAWLSAQSLADGKDELKLKGCKHCLAGLGVAFRELFKTTDNRAFAMALGACGQIGLQLPPVDATNQSYLEDRCTESRRAGVPDLSTTQAIDAIRKAVVLASYETLDEADQIYFERLIGEPESYRYTALSRMVAETATKKK